MIPALIFTVSGALACPEVKVVNDTKEWTSKDARSMLQAEVRCPEIYPDAPCLKFFKKKEDGVYQALCGKAK
jgi:hypothetical protein